MTATLLFNSRSNQIKKPQRGIDGLFQNKFRQPIRHKPCDTRERSKHMRHLADVIECCEGTCACAVAVKVALLDLEKEENHKICIFVAWKCKARVHTVSPQNTWHTSNLGAPAPSPCAERNRWAGARSRPRHTHFCTECNTTKTCAKKSTMKTVAGEWVAGGWVTTERDH